MRRIARQRLAPVLSQPDQVSACANLRVERPATKVGSYALQFFWADDHNTGIYGFEFLRHKSP